MQPLRNFLGLLALASSMVGLRGAATIWAATCSVVARISKFLSFLLPFKALLIATGSRLPSIFPEHLTPVDVAGGLILLSVFFFLLYVLAAAGLARTIDAIRTEEPSHESVGVRDFSDSVAFISVLVIFGALLGATSVVLPKLGLVLLLLFLAGILASLPRGVEIDAEVMREAGRRWERIGYVVQILALGAIVYFIVGSREISVLAGMFVFISARQMNATCGELVRLLLGFESRTSQLVVNERSDALSANPPVLPPYLIGESAGEWIGARLAAVGADAEAGTTPLRWMAHGARHVHSFLAGNDFQYVLNISGRRNLGSGLREAVFLEANPHVLTALKFLGRDDLGDVSVNIFEGTEAPVALVRDRATVRAVMERLWCVDPGSLQEIAVREAITGVTRLKERAEALVVVATSDNAKTIDNLLDNWRSVTEYVHALPVSLHNPDLGSRSIVQAGSNFDCLFWSRASLEPIGSTLWRVQGGKGMDLVRLLENVKSVRADCSELDQYDLQIAAHYYGLVKTLQNGWYSDALKCAVSLWRTFRRKHGEKTEPASPEVRSSLSEKEG